MGNPLIIRLFLSFFLCGCVCRSIRRICTLPSTPLPGRLASTSGHTSLSQRHGRAPSAICVCHRYLDSYFVVGSPKEEKSKESVRPAWIVGGYCRRGPVKSTFFTNLPLNNHPVSRAPIIRLSIFPLPHPSTFTPPIGRCSGGEYDPPPVASIIASHTSVFTC